VILHVTKMNLSATGFIAATGSTTRSQIAVHESKPINVPRFSLTCQTNTWATLQTCPCGADAGFLWAQWA